MVEKRRIELPSAACKTAVLPLNDIPTAVVEGLEPSTAGLTVQCACQERLTTLVPEEGIEPTVRYAPQIYSLLDHLGHSGTVDVGGFEPPTPDVSDRCSNLLSYTPLARVTGLEPATGGFGDRCSSELSYTPAFYGKRATRLVNYTSFFFPSATDRNRTCAHRASTGCSTC